MKSIIDNRLGVRELWSGELSISVGGLGRSCKSEYELTIAMSRM